LGALSYAIYLIHEIMRYTMHRFIANADPMDSGHAKTLLINFLALAATLGLALISRRFLEGPAMRFARRFRYSQTT
jgi:peptidoglycan/LPS O-acetylase OafA/YrhL